MPLQSNIFIQIPRVILFMWWFLICLWRTVRSPRFLVELDNSKFILWKLSWPSRVQMTGAVWNLQQTVSMVDVKHCEAVSLDFRQSKPTAFWCVETAGCWSQFGRAQGSWIASEVAVAPRNLADDYGKNVNFSFRWRQKQVLENYSGRIPDDSRIAGWA